MTGTSSHQGTLHYTILWQRHWPINAHRTPFYDRDIIPPRHTALHHFMTDTDQLTLIIHHFDFMTGTSSHYGTLHYTILWQTLTNQRSLYTILGQGHHPTKAHRITPFYGRHWPIDVNHTPFWFYDRDIIPLRHTSLHHYMADIDQSTLIVHHFMIGASSHQAHCITPFYGRHRPINAHRTPFLDFMKHHPIKACCTIPSNDLMAETLSNHRALYTIFRFYDTNSDIIQSRHAALHHLWPRHCPINVHRTTPFYDTKCYQGKLHYTILRQGHCPVNAHCTTPFYDTHNPISAHCSSTILICFRQRPLSVGSSDFHKCYQCTPL